MGEDEVDGGHDVGRMQEKANACLGPLIGSRPLHALVGMSSGSGSQAPMAADADTVRIDTTGS